jgi:hypothetical protein
VLFALTGIALFAYWALARPSLGMTSWMREWSHVLWFSATLLLLAGALVTFGRMVGSRQVVGVATLAGAAIALSSLANVIEDGFRVDAAFFLFILGTLIGLIALLALAVTITRTGSDRSRLLALVPAATMAGLLLFVPSGGPILLITWLVAAGLAVDAGPSSASIGR